jgi:hypothetical protein
MPPRLYTLCLEVLIPLVERTGEGQDFGPGKGPLDSVGKIEPTSLNMPGPPDEAVPAPLKANTDIQQFGPRPRVSLSYTFPYFQKL